MYPLAAMHLRQRRKAVAEFKHHHLTPAVREAMRTLGMSEEEYDRRLMDVLFPYPIHRLRQRQQRQQYLRRRQ